ncbi:hypothetical protein ABZY19_35545 [Streptomyces sp. NPDC006475]|uniref:hypothetical protein n=1 Tax=Streptomyces sp. NPDC006475 TaxID=3155719 RepID=UPI0033A5EA39
MTHDFDLLSRRFQGQSVSEWELLSHITPRRWTQMLWFPERREEEAVLDLCQELSSLAVQGEPNLRDTAAYGILRDHVRSSLRDPHPEADSLQFMIVRAAGHDGSEDPQCAFVSAVESLHC